MIFTHKVLPMSPLSLILGMFRSESMSDGGARGGSVRSL